ncbi:MAG: orotate phosphoribosyltransferase [Desulfurococcales archaeon]|nr:orotate phosphoribosyltransferase [Desulfurococcales archaeon]
MALGETTPGPWEKIERLAAFTLVESGAVRRGRFRLSSGEETDIYVDARSVLGKPRVFRALLSMLYSVFHRYIPEGGVVGVATGGIPWATGLALTAGVPAGYVRPQAKEHGLGRRVEGLDPPGEVVVVDDVATTGGSLLASIKALREAGFEVYTAIVLVDREAGAREKLGEENVLLLSLTRLSVIRGILEGVQSP